MDFDKLKHITRSDNVRTSNLYNDWKVFTDWYACEKRDSEHGMWMDKNRGTLKESGLTVFSPADPHQICIHWNVNDLKNQK